MRIRGWISDVYLSDFFGGLVLHWPVGRPSDRIDRRTVLIGVGAALGIVSFVALAASPRDGVVLWLVVGLFGGFCFALYPLSVAHANDFIEPRDVVPASGGLLLAYSIGAVLGPLGDRKSTRLNSSH